LGNGDGTRRVGVLLEAYRLLEGLHRELDAGQRELEIATGGRPLCVTNCGDCCVRSVPVAIAIEATYVLSHQPYLPMRDIRQRALGWMGEHHPNLKLYEKIRGRPYRQEERAQLADDQATLEKTGCPFLARDKTCILHSLRPLVCRGYGVTWAADSYCPRPLHSTETSERRMGLGPSGPRGKRIQKLKGHLLAHLRTNAPDLLSCSWFPGLLAKEMGKEEVLALQREGKVADIKLAMGYRAPRLWRDEAAEEIAPLEVAHA